jgi:hypothetical protein
MNMNRSLILLAFCLFVCAGSAAAQNGSGSISASATASEYLDVSIGGSATLSGNNGGSVSGTQTSGSPLSLTADLGEVGPSNANSFVKLAVPLRLQSNVPYDLKLAISGTDNSGLQLQFSDIGFGLGAVSRTDTGVLEGNDTFATGVSGDPTSDLDATAGGRWNWVAGRSLVGYTTQATVLTGSRIMDVVPNGDAGLRVTSYFAIKPQFFEPKSLSTTLTFTIVAGS